MVRKGLLLLLAVSIGVMPARAQWYRRVGKALRPSLERVHVSSSRTPGQLLFTHVEQAAAIRHAQQVLRWKKGKQNLPPVLRNSVFVLQEKHPLIRWVNENVTATSFIVEETYQGKKYWWGVTAAHYHFVKPALQHPAYHWPLRVTFQAQGNEGMTDIVLFPLSPDTKEITPLKLATKPVQLGEKLHSVGFFSREFRLEEGRQVQEVTPQRILTSLPPQPGINRVGACGGPVLNAQEEVVGVHVGSTSSGNIGFVVPAAHLQRLLTAYHEGSAPQPLIFNGKELGSIQVNDCILRICVARGQDILSTHIPYHKETYLDYAHLEEAVNLEDAKYKDADRILFIIQRMPFSSKNKDKKTHTFKLTYNLKNGQTSWEQDDSYASGF